MAFCPGITAIFSDMAIAPKRKLINALLLRGGDELHPKILPIIRKCRRVFLFSLFFSSIFTVLVSHGQRTKVTGDSLEILDSLVNSSKINNVQGAKLFARRALVIAHGMTDPSATVKAYVMLGIAYNLNDKDSSYMYFNKALKIADSSKSVAQIPIILYNLAILNKAAHNYRTAIVMLDSSIRLAEADKNFPVISDAYNSLGNIKYDVEDNKDAQRHYDSAFQIAKRHSLYKQMGVALGNLARFEKDHSTSVRMQREAISYLRNRFGTQEEIALILINIGYWFTNPDSALFYFRSALELAKNGGLHVVEMAAFNNMAYSYLDKGNLELAEDCLAGHAIPIALRENNSDWQSTLYDSYADVLVAKGDYKAAIGVEKKAMDARIEATKKQASGEVRLLAALLDLNNKEITIQKKEKEILVQKNRLQQTRLWLTITVLVAIGFLFVFLWLQQRTRMKLQRQQISSAKRIIEMEESEKGRTARELHDITGQLVMGITGEIENLDFHDPQSKDLIKGKIKDLGKSIRLISHRMNRAMMEHFSFEELIVGQCEDVQKLTGLPVDVDISVKELSLPEETILHIYRIIQELLTNASKYVKTGRVNIRISAEMGSLIVFYQDNGPGFDPAIVEKSGMGLRNIFERAKLLGGVATLDTSPGYGASWQISIPLDKKKKLNA
jgi:two-component system, NarL family, sensor kinase